MSVNSRLTVPWGSEAIGPTLLPLTPPDHLERLTERGKLKPVFRSVGRFQRLVVKTSAGTLWNPYVSIGALGCSGSGRSKALRHRNGVWQFTVPRRRGAYELLVSSRFDTDEVHGDTSVAFGVVVSRTKARRIVPASQYAVC